jgi:hypothetical protein
MARNDDAALPMWVFEHIVPAASPALPALALEPGHNLRPARLQHNAQIYAQLMSGTSLAFIDITPPRLYVFLQET